MLQHNALLDFYASARTEASVCRARCLEPQLATEGSSATGVRRSATGARSAVVDGDQARDADDVQDQDRDRVRTQSHVLLLGSEDQPEDVHPG